MAEQPNTRVLLLFDSRGGLTEQLAEAVAEGVRSVPSIELRYRRLDEAETSELVGRHPVTLSPSLRSG